MRTLVVLTLVSLAIAAAGCSGDGDGDGEETLEYKMAVINAGGFVEPNDPIVAQFATLLNSLEGKCTEDREGISGMSITTQRLLSENSVNLSLLEVLTHMNNALPADAVEFGDCPGVFAAFVAITNSP